LGLPPSMRAAVVGFTMRTHILGFARLIGTFSRPAAWCSSPPENWP